MLSLLIDTSFIDVIVCLYKNGKLKRIEKIEGQKYNSQFIMPTVKKVLEDQMPDEVLVVNGPGSFTGVRLGVTIAKTLAYTLNVPIKTITSLEQMAVSLNQEKKIVGLSDGNGCYVGIFDEENNLIGDYKYLNNDEYNQFCQDYTVVTKVEIDYNEVYNFLKKREALNPHAVRPIYIKKISVQK
jgi:tRNA threonylcarbamoyl adenosine modification protein YeaZ